ncbi:MAG: hypothetical protein IIZ14_00825 [Solobacterium sp.]|nr:hypothetical protein [Solobacterium sp.]
MKSFDVLGVQVVVDPEADEQEALLLAERFIRERYARPLRICLSERTPGRHQIGFMPPDSVRSAAVSGLPYKEIPLPAGKGLLYGLYGFRMAELTDEDLETAVLFWTSSVYIGLWDGELYIDD